MKHLPESFPLFYAVFPSAERQARFPRIPSFRPPRNPQKKALFPQAQGENTHPARGWESFLRRGQKHAAFSRSPPACGASCRARFRPFRQASKTRPLGVTGRKVRKKEGSRKGSRRATLPYGSRLSRAGPGCRAGTRGASLRRETSASSKKAASAVMARPFPQKKPSGPARRPSSRQSVPAFFLTPLLTGREGG